MPKKKLASKHYLWRKWTCIQQSCYNINSPDYQYAGARGATCHWNNFWDFAQWVDANLGKPPKNKPRLCRIDTDGDYAPGNLFWANQQIHNNKNHSACMLKYQGQEMSLKDWSRKIKVSYWSLTQRRYRGLPVDQILRELK